MTDTREQTWHPAGTVTAAGIRDLELLRSTRGLTAMAVVFLGVQLYGNLYEQIVTNLGVIADPQPAALSSELDPGSPLYFYLPWAPLGVVLVLVLARRLQRGGPEWAARRLRWAIGALAIAVAAKIVLITQLNDTFRDPGTSPDQLRENAILWALGNGVSILAVAAAVVLITAWRSRLLDDAISAE